MKILTLVFVSLLLNPLSAGIKKKFSADLLIPKNNYFMTGLKDDWIATDKGQHFLGSFMATGIATLSLKRFAGYSSSKSINIGVSFSLSLGLLKETYDGRNNWQRFSYKDLTADLLGTFLGYLVFR